LTIPTRLLIAGGDFGDGLPAAKVVAAIAGGIREGGMPEPDLCPLPDIGRADEEVRGLLDSIDFDARMRSARAVVVADERLRERTLAGSMTFEIATRARQGGVPAYAITAHNELEAFDARILDLQLILEAGSGRALRAAGRKLVRMALTPEARQL
jgi:glycerate kinase